MRMLIAMLFAVLVSSGCATLGGNTVSITSGDGTKKEVSIDPIQFVGIEWTEAISQGRFKAYIGNFPKGLFSDMHPLRVRYNAVAYGVNSGKEYPAQAIYTGSVECALRMTILVEGNPDEPIVGAFATTRFTRLFSLQGDEILVKTPEKLAIDAGYRKEVVLSGGTNVKRLNPVPVEGQDGLRSEFKSWTRFRVNPKAAMEMRSPIPEEFIRSVARENPEIAFQEKLVANGQFGLSLSWFSIAMGAAQDVITAAGAADKGWDEKSELNRGQQGMIAQIIDEQRQQDKSCTSDRRRVIKY